MKYLKIIKIIFANITFSRRQDVEIKFRKKAIAYNLFRIYEYIFGRRTGIRFESLVIMDSKGKIYRCFGTIESILVYFEYLLRNLFVLDFIKIQVYVPQMATPQGVNFPVGYMFAIAYDTANSSAGTGTISITISGSNTYAYGCQDTGGNTGQSATLNGVAMTAGVNFNLQTGYYMQTYYLASPTTGNFVPNTSLGAYGSLIGNWSGVDQGAPIGSQTGSSAGTSFSVNINVGTANCWAFATLFANNGTATCTAGGTIRRNSPSLGANAPALADSNGVITTGGYTMTFGGASGQPYGGVVYAFKEYAAGGGATYIPKILTS